MSTIPASRFTKVLKISLVLTIVTLIPLFSQAQFSNQKWKQFRNEVYLGFGATQFLGDLGGSIESGNHGLKDINMLASRYMVSGGLRVKVSEYFTVRGDFAYGRLSGADSLTENPDRRGRNLSFRAPFFTFSPLVEFYALPEDFGRGAKSISAYVATGVRFMYFNPQGQRGGDWYDLQPLGTEGQLLASNGGKAYNRYTFVMPFIVGFKYAIHSQRGGKSGAWTIGFEAAANWTFSDYIDDVSTKYADPLAVYQTSGELGAYFADRRLTDSYGTTGGIRGNPEYNDWYGHIQIIIGKQLYSRTKRGSRYSRKASERRRSSTY